MTEIKAPVNPEFIIQIEKLKEIAIEINRAFSDLKESLEILSMTEILLTDKQN